MNNAVPLQFCISYFVKWYNPSTQFFSSDIVIGDGGKRSHLSS
ncbi:MAG: hypothetical protein V7K88_28495 [Nostoc sp.]